MWPAGDLGTVVGREAETDKLRSVLVEAGTAGRGRAVLIGGEPGIGKSTVLAYGLGGTHLGERRWADADELSTRVPLSLALDLLGLDHPYRDGVEELVDLVARRCADGPVVLVADQLQWADERSLLVWSRLAELTVRAPLVLAGAYRPVPRRPELAALRRAVARAGGLDLTLAPLPPEHAQALVADVPEPRRTAILAGTAGNPRYLAAAAAGEVPVAELGFLSADAATVLNGAALLGAEFTVADLAAVLGRTARELARPLAEATDAGLIEPAGPRLAFRHALVRDALYGAIPASVRAGLHRHAAQALDGTGAEPERVAAHLTRAPSAGDSWVAQWLTRHADALAAEVAGDLLDRTLDGLVPGDPAWDRLAVARVRTAPRLGRDPVPLARQALEAGTDPAARAELCWILGTRELRDGRTGGLGALADQGLAGSHVPAPWRVRLGVLAAIAEAYATGESPDTEAAVRGALARAEASGDALATGYGLIALAIVHQVRRDQVTRLAYLDRALAVLGADDRLVQCHRVYALHLLDRFTDAEEVPIDGVPAAIVAYCTGRWDDALRTLAAAGQGAGALAALIAVHRDDSTVAAQRLALVPEDGSGFRLTARAVLAEREGDPARARDVLAGVLTPRYARMDRHMLLPHLVRMALAAGDPATASAALAAAEADAAAQPVPARIAAAAYCRGLLTGAIEPLRQAVAHLERVRRAVDLAQAGEELAVAYAAAGHTASARLTAAAAKDGYARLGAVWAARRVDARLRGHGVRLGPRGPRRGAGCGGWTALSPTEVTIARLVAQGRSNPDIANELLLSRRTVQSHVSNILAKLRARTRTEIAREAQRHL